MGCTLVYCISESSLIGPSEQEIAATLDLSTRHLHVRRWLKIQPNSRAFTIAAFPEATVVENAGVPSAVEEKGLIASDFF